jgi:iron complex outermembrane recepter protein
MAIALVVLSAASASAQTSDDDPAEVTPPRVLEAPAPPLPSGHPTDGPPPRVGLLVTVGPDGAVRKARIVDPTGAPLETLALEAIWTWRFEPAHRGQAPVAAEVPVTMTFGPPAAHAAPPPDESADDSVEEGDVDAPQVEDAAEPGPKRDAEETASAPADAPTDEEPLLSFGAAAQVVAPDLRAKGRSASDFTVERDVLTAAPHGEAGDLLRVVPGVFIARNEGDAVAHRIMLRGFDADHGQDMEITVGGLPVNQISHLHGQGYADLGFVIPEVVQRVRVTEGVYDPRQGDFAVAGTVDMQLGVEERGFHFATTYGSFNTLRQVGVWAPEGQGDATFGAFAFRKTDGFGQNRAGRSGSAMAQHEIRAGDWRWRILGSLYGARFQMAGVVRHDDIEAGNVGFYDVYPLPTAQAQNAMATRAQLAVFGTHRGDDGQNSEIGLFLLHNTFRVQQNFTGFLERSRFNPEWVGRGDLIEQTNDGWTLGARARHRSQHYRPTGWADGHVEAGIHTRLDLIDQAQNLIRAPQNETWDRRVDASITAADVGAYVDLDWQLTQYIKLHGGLRADVLFYQVNDRLRNFIPLFRREDHIVGFRRSAMGLATGPRAAVEVDPFPWLTILGAYGEGFRSPQARILDDGETTPFAKVRSGDVGLRFKVGPDERLVVTTSAYMTSLSEDIAFDPTEGRLERIGPTTRKGAVLYAVARPWDWLVGSLSATFVQATLDAPPPPTTADPTPPYEEGERLPYVPPWVVRADVGARHRLGTLGGEPVMGRLGFGYSFLSPRPLPFGGFAAPVSVVDASVSVRWREIELTLDVFNLLDQRWAAGEFSFVSHWQPNEPASRIPARHIAAGPPRTVLFTVGLHL